MLFRLADNTKPRPSDDGVDGAPAGNEVDALGVGDGWAETVPGIHAFDSKPSLEQSVPELARLRQRMQRATADLKRIIHSVRRTGDGR